MLPIYYAVAHYYGFRRDEKQEIKYLNLYSSGLQAAKRRYGTRARGNIIKGKGRLGSGGGTYPRHFPLSIT